MRPYPHRHEGVAAKTGRLLGDLAVLALFFVVMYLFFAKNGFVGTNGIQPYPY